MSANEIFIDPTTYDSEVDAFKGTTEKIASSNEFDVAAVKRQTLLDAMDTLEEVIETYKSCVENYVELSTKDVAELKRLKEMWVQADQMIANDIG